MDQGTETPIQIQPAIKTPKLSQKRKVFLVVLGIIVISTISFSVFFGKKTLFKGQVTNVATEAQPPTLLVHYAFEETSVEVASDVSGNGKDGTIIGAQKTVGSVGGGQALSFDGDDDSVDIPHTFVTSGANGSYSFWVWVDPTPPADTWLTFLNQKMGGSNYCYDVRYHPEQNVLIYLSTNGENGTSGDYSIDLGNKWTHIAVTWDNTAGHLFINGENVANGTAPSCTQAVSSFRLGRNSYDNASNDFKGFLDEVKIFQGMLTQQQIRQEYERFLPLPISAPVLPIPICTDSQFNCTEWNVCSGEENSTRECSVNNGESCTLSPDLLLSQACEPPTPMPPTPPQAPSAQQLDLEQQIQALQNQINSLQNQLSAAQAQGQSAVSLASLERQIAELTATLNQRLASGPQQVIVQVQQPPAAIQPAAATIQAASPIPVCPNGFTYDSARSACVITADEEETPAPTVAVPAAAVPSAAPAAAREKAEPPPEEEMTGSTLAETDEESESSIAEALAALPAQSAAAKSGAKSGGISRPRPVRAAADSPPPTASEMFEGTSIQGGTGPALIIYPLLLGAANAILYFNKKRKSRLHAGKTIADDLENSLPC